LETGAAAREHSYTKSRFRVGAILVHIFTHFRDGGRRHRDCCYCILSFHYSSLWLRSLGLSRPYGRRRSLLIPAPETRFPDRSSNRFGSLKCSGKSAFGQSKDSDSRMVCTASDREATKLIRDVSSGRSKPSRRPMRNPRPPAATPAR